MEWPWQRFETMYLAHMRRKAVQQLENIKLAQLAGSWGNPNFDGEKDARRQFLDDVESNYWSGVATIYGVKLETEIDYETDPLFTKVKLPEVPDGIDTGALRDRGDWPSGADTDQE